MLSEVSESPVQAKRGIGNSTSHRLQEELSDLGKTTWPAGDEESRHSIVDCASLMDEVGLGVSHAFSP